MINKFYNNATFSTWLAYTVQFGTAIFLLPLILYNFDSAEISLWFLFYIVIGMSVLADFGFGPTVIRTLSYLYVGVSNIPTSIEEFKTNTIEYKSGKPNLNKINEYISTYHTLYLFLALFSSFLALVVGFFIVNNAIELAGNTIDLWYAFYFIVAKTLFTINQIKWTSLLSGMNQVASAKRSETLVNLFKILIMAGEIIGGYGLLELMLTELIASIILLIVVKQKVYKFYKGIGGVVPGKYSFNKEILRITWPPTWRLGLIQLGGYGINNSAGLVVAQINNVDVIAAFLFTQRVLLFIRQISQVPLYANLPKVFQLMASGNKRKLKFFCSKAIRLSLCLLLLALLVINILGNEMLSLLNIDRQLIDGKILLIMSFALVLEMHHAMHSQIYMGSNRVPFLIPSIVSALSIFIISYNIIEEYGVISVVLTQFFVQLSINNWYPVYLNLKLLDWPFVNYLESLINVKERSNTL